MNTIQSSRHENNSRERLKDRIHILSLICEAALGKPVRIQSNAALSEVKDFTGGAGTDGCIIYLPDTACDFSLYKLMALHQSMLIDKILLKNESENTIAAVTQTHLDADRRLLDRLPGLRRDMNRLMDGGLPSSYPTGVDHSFPTAPWWGDILPDLMHQTQTAIAELQERACQYIDCSPEIVEGYLSGMMAGGQRTVDGLWERLRLMFRTSDFGSPDPETLSEDVRTFHYPEWDKNISGYKKDWCLVRERSASEAPNSFVRDVRARLHGLIPLVRKRFLRLKPEQFRRYRAQAFGDDLDIDTLIQAVIDRRAGSYLSENVYVRRDKWLRDVAVLFLLDLSESTEEKVNGRRVIDIHKEAVVLMSEALNALDDTYGLYGFNSDGRFRVNMFTIKAVNEPYDDRVERRIGNISPDGLTRLGAAIRHATSRLESIQSRTRLMIILTDGRPYDSDYGDMAYAAGDTKKAIQEAEKLKIHPFIITSDPEGARYLKQISPMSQSIILPRVDLLPHRLPAIYKRLTT